MPPGVQPQIELLTQGYGGVNNSLQFSQLQREQSPLMQNAYQSKIGAISKRPGSRPMTTSALAANIEYLSIYKSVPSAAGGEDIYAASGTTYYKWNGTTAFSALTMTAALNRASIYTIAFTNAALTSVELIADGASLKRSSGAIVTLVTPAADDAAPAPANGLAAINVKGINFIWTYTDHVFMSPGTTELFYSKRYQFDYAPTTFYLQLVRENDYINGNGQAFDSVCLVPMRRGWAIITGETSSNFAADKFLNTKHGVIAPRTVVKMTYPDGTQTIPFLSDNEVHEVYTAVIDTGGRQYATRSLMAEKIDFPALGLTDAEKAAAVGVFHPEKFLYILSFQKSGVDYTYAYDCRNREWYTDWLTFNAKAYASLNGILYFAGSLKHLCKFDDTLYTDWNESVMTTGTAVYFKRYSSLMSLEQTGYASYWDYYIIEQKQYPLPSTLDVTVFFTDQSVDAANVIDTSSATWDATDWDEAVWANEDFTSSVNEPRRIVYKKKSRYTQVLWENSRDEPIEVYFDRWLGRSSGQ